MNIQENVSLKPFNTFGIDKKAKFYCCANSIHELIEALTWANETNLKIIILGGGSNILLTKDVNALVIKINLKGIHVISEDQNHLLVEVGAGENWHEWVLYALEKNWAGLENLSLIPGTVGASPMQNIGAYGVEIKDVFHSLTALNRVTLKLESFDAQSCKFGYRESVFKHELKNQYIITSVTFQLKKYPVFHVDYGAIQEIIQKNEIKELTIKAISDAVIEIRKSKLPDPKEVGNAGSFFKNPTIPAYQFEKLKDKYPTLPGYAGIDGVKVPAGWLIEQAGWKGKRFGEVGVHDKQALVLVNHGHGTGDEIKMLAEMIQDSVLENFGIILVPEVNFI